MTNYLIIGIIAGLCTALLNLSGYVGGMFGLGIFLIILSPLPLMIASLGWGSFTGLIAVLSSGVALSAADQPTGWPYIHGGEQHSTLVAGATDNPQPDKQRNRRSHLVSHRSTADMDCVHRLHYQRGHVHPVRLQSSTSIVTRFRP